MRVESFFRERVRQNPNKPFLILGDERITYGEMEGQVNRLARVLFEKGVERGDRVVVYAEPSALAVVSIYAALRAGAVFSPINPSTKPDKLSFVLKNCRAKAIVTQAGLLSNARQAVELSGQATQIFADHSVDSSSGSACHSLPELLPVSSDAEIPHGGIDIDLAMLIYTSGSTGFPKGVMMSHQNIATAAHSISTYLELTGDDIILNALPLSFDYGLYQVLMAATVGATVIQEKSFAFPAAVLQKMLRERATVFPLVPTMAALLLRMRDLAPGGYPALRAITNTAAALPPAHILRLQELFPTTRIFSMYGLTECKRCTYLPPEQLTIRPDSVGKAIPNSEGYIVNDQGERLGPGQVGELVIRGGHVMKGYWENHEATDRCLKPGPHPWEKVLHTGDLFRMDEEGYFYFVGRKDDIIKTRGEKVSPKEVENVLYALPGVKEAAVIGIPDAILGMAIKACIVQSEVNGLSERDVTAHCAKHLEDFMVPRHVEFVSELPQTDTGKIRRSQVQAEALTNLTLPLERLVDRSSGSLLRSD